MCGQKPMTALQQLSEDSLLEDNMRFHGIAADWVTDFKAEVEQRFNKKPFSQELTSAYKDYSDNKAMPKMWPTHLCSQ